MDSGKLQGLRVVSFESRRTEELAKLIARHGGELIQAPALREVPLSSNEAAFEFAHALCGGKIDVVVLLTGVGTRLLAQTVLERFGRDPFLQALGSATTVARGPKPVAALRELGLKPTITVPEPNTWREVVHSLDAKVHVAGKRVAVQEYGQPNPELVAALAERGAEVRTVPLYRWALPEDLAPLQEAIREILAGSVDIALFMSAVQADHLFEVAGSERAEALRDALGKVVVASIGPMCSLALRRHGLDVSLEPDHPKMGSLVSALAERGPELVRAKRH